MASFSNPPEGFEQVEAERDAAQVTPEAPGGKSLIIDVHLGRVRQFCRGIGARILTQHLLAGQNPTKALTEEIVTLMTAAAVTSIGTVPADGKTAEDVWKELCDHAWQTSKNPTFDDYRAAVSDVKVADGA